MVPSHVGLSASKPHPRPPVPPRGPFVPAPGTCRRRGPSWLTSTLTSVHVMAPGFLNFALVLVLFGRAYRHVTIARSDVVGVDLRRPHTRALGLRSASRRSSSTRQADDEHLCTASTPPLSHRSGVRVESAAPGDAGNPANQSAPPQVARSPRSISRKLL